MNTQRSALRDPAGTPRPERRDPPTDPLPAIALGLTAVGIVATLVLGISSEQIGALGALVLFVGYPLHSIASQRLHERRLGTPVARRPVRQLLGEAAVVAVLLLLGWGLLQSALRGPQPGDIVCELYDPRLGDCVVERVYTGE